MMLANYHTHTVRCKHAESTEREYIETAIKEGLQIIGFSDHAPQPYPKGFVSRIRMDMEELEDYTDTLVRLREEYKDKIKVLIGYEVEYTEKYFEPLLKILREYPLDYMIQGQHYVRDEVDGFYAGKATEDEAKLKEYVDFTIEGMKTGLFSYLAHPDLLNFKGPDDVYRKHMSRLIEAAVDLKLPLEINMYGYFDNRWYPSERFFKLAGEYNADIVIGADAHKLKILKQVDNVPGLVKFMEDCNVTYIKDNIVNLRNCK